MNEALLTGESVPLLKESLSSALSIGDISLDEHIDVLSKLADLIEDPEDAKKIWGIDSIDEIYELFS